jgi:hypothetical protein
MIASVLRQELSKCLLLGVQLVRPLKLFNSKSFTHTVLFNKVHGISVGIGVLRFTL